MGIVKLFFGINKNIKLKLGSKDTKLYLGNNLIYPRELYDAVVTCNSTTYNGSLQTAQNIVVKINGETLIENQDYVVTQNNGGTNAGSYPVVVSGINYFASTASTTFVINKASGSVTTKPTAKSGLIYNGSAQALVNAGSGTGTMLYSLNNSTYSTNIPSGTNATSYTVYYKASASTNYNESTTGSVSVSIAKVTPTITAPTAKSLTYNGSAQALVNAGSTNWGTLKYSLDNSTYSTNIPSGTNATSYTVYYKVDGDSNINSVAVQTIGVSIAKANTTYTAPTANNRTYDTTSKALLNAGAVTGGTMQYSSDNSNWSTTIPSGTNANTYTTYWRIVGDSNHNDKASASISTTISPKTVSSPTITLSQDSYVYSNTAYQPTPTVKDGSVTISSSEYTVSYSNNTNVGTATCTITDKTGGNYTVSGSKSFTITKVTPTVTAPTPKTLTFNNANQVLANAGSTNWGTIQYCLNNSGGTYSTTVPSASAANVTYKVWYKVVGNSNINDVAPASIDCMIAEKRVTTPTIVLDPTSYTYNGSARQPSVTVKDGSVVIPAAEYTTTYSNNTNAGTATVTITDNTAGNYYISGTTTFTINKASGSVTTAPTAKSLTYNAAAQQLVNAGSGTGTMMYKLDSGSWGTSIPTATNATSYTVYYKASASTNYNESASGSVGVTISKVNPTVTAPKACGLTYTGNAQNLVSGGSTNYGTLVYSTTSGGTYSTTIPQGTNATSYTVWYKVNGNTNVNDTTPASVAITIAKANTTYTAPTANNRTYDTTSKALLNAGTVTGGTIYYSSDNSTWSTTIPSQTNAGTYTTYWKITGDSNHNDKASASISTTISAKTVSSPTITLSQTAYTYSNSACQPTPTVKDGTTTISSGEYTVSYSNNVNVGTATCTITDKSGGNYTVSGSKTFTINCYSATAPTAKSLTYNTSAQALANAGSTSYGTMVYCSTSGGTFSTTIPTGTNAGSYEVWWKVTGNTNVCNTAATKVSCSIAAKTVSSPTITLSPSSYVYSNSACQPTPTVKDGSTTIASSEYTVSYSNNVNAGTATCTITDKSGGNYTVSGSKTFTISKYTPTAPTAKNPNWTGSAQNLVNAGSTSYGTMVYSTTSGGTYSTTIPQGTNAGSYEVWWKVTGNTNVNNTEPTKISCSINKVAMSYTAPSGRTLNYSGSGQALMTGGAATGGSIQYSTASTGTYSTTVPTQTNVGTYTTWWKAVPDSNHSGGTSAASASTTINKVAMTYTAPKVTIYTYANTARALVSGASANGGSIQYCATSGGTYSTTVPTQTNAGTYDTWWKAVPDSNHSGGTSAAKLTTTINCYSATAPTAKNPNWTGSAQALVNAGSTSYGTVVYSTNNSTFNTTIPSGTSAGSYTVYWKVTGNTNVCQTTSASISCSIKQVAMSYTAPSAATRTYTGSAQQIVSGGSANGGSIYYATSSAGASSSTTVPTQTNAGTYTIYWKAVPDGNHSGGTSSWTAISCTIAKAAMTYSAPKAAVRTYNGAAQQIVSGQSAAGGSIYYATSSAGASSSTTVPTQTNTGTTYSTYWKAVPDSNHSGGTSTWTQITGCTINKASLTITAKEQTINYGSSIATGTSQATASGLVGGDSLTAITLTQSTKNVPGGVIFPSAAETTKGIANYSVSYYNGTLTINKVAMSYTAPKAAVRTYNGSAQQIVSGQSAAGGSIQFCSTSGGTYSTTVPTQTNASTSYSTWWKAVPDSNHSGGTSAAQITGCTINKAAGSVTTAPTAKSLTYNGSSQALVNAGSGTGTMMYKLDSGSWGTSIPTATNATSYTVYYKASASTNYNESASGSVSVTINKASRTMSWSSAPSSVEKGKTVTATATRTGDGTIAYSSSNTNMATINSSTGVITGVGNGTCTITASVPATTNYNSGSTSYTLTCIDYSQTYLTFTATESGTFKFSGNSISYSTNNGSTWTSLASDTNSPTVSAGSKIMWKATGLTPTSSIGIGIFSSTSNFTVEGNAMSLLYGDDFIGQTSLSGKDYAFYGLFNGCTGMTSAENLVLPATTLAQECYSNMFNNCTSLTKAPSTLPAMTLADVCYSYMFQNCTSLTTAPTLPATNLSGAIQCYYNMFYNCTSLTTAPSLPATTLTSSCYSSMFRNCTSLTAAPSLPATALTSSCYNSMFQGCTSLTAAPILPATALTSSCYYNMFYNCTSLTTAPTLPATTLANNCYYYMFRNCTSLTTAPSLPATTLTTYCYYGMFQNCMSLTTAPSLPATTLANFCYREMFVGCINLTTAPSLPATTLTSNCYYGMFQNCTSLTAAPELPATTLVSNCYSNMFRGCTSLNYIKAMFTTTPSTSYMNNWVNGVASSGTFVMNPNASWNTGTTNCGVSTYPCNWLIKYDYSQNYLTFTATASGTFKLSGNSISYSLDSGTTWTSLASNTNSPTVSAGSKIMWKASLTPASNKGIGTFRSSGNFTVEGNAMSLLYGDNFANQTDLTGKNYAFYRLFSGCTGMTSAEYLVLPATTLASSCYRFMFYGCRSLTTAPSLPATTLPQYCYINMFANCSSLTTAPELPATTLVSNCYSNMFNGCTNLNYIKAMFTTTPSASYMQNWVTGVASSGTFVKNAAATWTSSCGTSTYPCNWTVETASS